MQGVFMELCRILNRLTLVLLAVVLMLGWLILTPQKMSEYEGYRAERWSMEECAVLQERVLSQLEAGQPSLINESEINAMLNATIEGEQSLLIRPWITVEGVYLNLESAERVSICLERAIYSRLQQVELQQSVRVSSMGTGHSTRSIMLTGGVVGKLKLPRSILGAFSIWMPTFTEVVAELFSEVRPLVGHMEIQEGGLLMHPLP